MHDQERRSYDLEIAELKNQIQDLTESVTALSESVKDLVDAWRTAKGITAFVKWMAAMAIAFGVLLSYWKHN